MKKVSWSRRISTAVFSLVLLTGCAAPGPYYTVSEPAPAPAPPPAYQPPEEAPGGVLSVGPNDRRFVLHVENRTPFGLGPLPQSMDLLYQKGYDQVRRQREADFGLDIAVFADARDNPNRRAEHVVGGALLGAATGAIIGGALGRPGVGAGIGAGSGAALGLVAPANTPMVRIDVRAQSFTDGNSTFRSVIVDLEHVPPYDVPRVIDTQVSRMLDSLPPK